MGRTTLAGRIFAALAATLAALFAAAAFWGEGRIRAFHREEVERRLGTAAALLEDLAGRGLRGDLPPGRLAAAVGGLRLEGDLRVTIIAADGTVIADSAARLPLENHATRPEVLEAARSGTGTEERHSASTGQDFLYFARRIAADGRTLGFVRVAEPLDRAEGEIASFRNALLLGGAGVLLVGLVASALVAAWIARPLREMESAAAAMAAGDLEVRAAVGGPEEVERLASSLNRMADEIRVRVEGARRHERMRMDFVANVSHELRTPLSALAGALETLEEPGLKPADRARFLEIASRNAARLRSLVQDLLDLSAIESEEESLALEPVPLDRVVRAAAGSLAPAAQKAGVALAVEPPAPGDLSIRAHPRRLEQAFVNLVENAVKYTPAGGRVAVRILDRGPDLAVEVEDTGVGIPAAAIPRIFERFYRVDPSRSRAMGGTGLGLAIVKHIVRAHRGRVEVRSAEGAGSTFTVLLPRAPTPGAIGRPATAP